MNGPRAAPVRAAVILPWDRSDRDRGEPGAQTRAAEHRLAEAVGLTASIGLVVVHTAILPLRAPPPRHAARRGPGGDAGPARSPSTA